MSGFPTPEERTIRTQARIDRVKDALQQGRTLEQIARYEMCQPASLLRWIHRNGLQHELDLARRRQR